MGKKGAWALLILSAAAVVLLFVFARERAEKRRRGGGPVVRARSAAPLRLAPTPLPPPPAEKTRVSLFFAAKDDGALRSEERDVEKPTDAAGFARTILREEIAGPKDPALVSPLPAGMTLRNAFVPGDGRVVVDMSVDPAWARSAGAGEELACVGAIVNSLLQNIAQTDRVEILVNGNTVETLAGHVDLSRPIPAMKDVLGGAVETAPGAGTSTATPSGTATSTSAPPPAPPPPGGATTSAPPPPGTSR